MKKIVTATIATLMVVSALNAGGFEKRSKMMESRIKARMETFSGHTAKTDFLNKKLACVKAASDVASLKACKKKFHPKTFKAIK
jgi:hypothetical protein